MKSTGGGEERGSSRGRGQPADIALSGRDRNLLMETLADVFTDATRVQPVLTTLDFPTGRVPGWGTGTSQDWWQLLFSELAAGIVPEGFRRLLEFAHERYPSNTVFLDLARRYGIDEGEDEDEPPAEACHVVMHAGDDEEREQVAAFLRERGLGPTVVWTTEDAVSFALNTPDARAVRGALGGASGWIVIPPGQPNYVLRELFIQGPDGSRFGITNVPAQQTVGDVAGAAASEYGSSFADTGRRAILDAVRNGQRQRLNPDHTLHQAEIRDGESLELGLESRAAVNPIDRDEALIRVHNQMLAFAADRDDFEVRPNWHEPPTEYEIVFRQPSYGPPPAEDAEPVPIETHDVLMQFDSEFPVTAPIIFWQSPFFHPNVYPNYDSDQARENPGAQGYLCLGELTEFWRSTVDFGHICQTLIDIAAYRNYSLYQYVGTETEDGLEVSRQGNYFDKAAARWLESREAEIEGAHDRSVLSGDRHESRYPVTVRRLG